MAISVGSSIHLNGTVEPGTRQFGYVEKTYDEEGVKKCNCVMVDDNNRLYLAPGLLESKLTEGHGT